MTTSPPIGSAVQSTALKADEVQVWKVNLAPNAALPADWQAVLSADERERAAHHRVAEARRRFVLVRHALRCLLASKLHIPPAAVRFSGPPNAKPALQGATGPTALRFNVSHSGDWGLIALALGREVGVDVEQHRDLPDALELATRFFAPDEATTLRSLPATVQRQAFFDAWTRKEAFVKALGKGLFLPLNHFSVSLAPNEPARLLRVADDPAAAAKWRLASLDVGGGYSAALVVEGFLGPEGIRWQTETAALQRLTGDSVK